MNIPTMLETEKFFLAHTETHAHSSWDSLHEALTQLKEFDTENSNSILGIIKVDSRGANFVFMPATLTS